MKLTIGFKNRKQATFYQYFSDFFKTFIQLSSTLNKYEIFLKINLNIQYRNLHFLPRFTKCITLNNILF